MYGLIFDIHGVLVDSNPARAQAWVEAHHELGFEANYSDVYSLTGTAPNVLLLHTIGIGIAIPEGRAVFERYNTLFERRFLPRLITEFRAPELVKTLSTINLKLGIASIDPPSTLLSLLRTGQCAFLYHTTTETQRALGLDSDRDLLKAASQRLGCPPNSTLLVTASESQCQAAQQLNLRTIGIKTSHWSEPGRSLATTTYESTAEFEANWHSSPIVMLGRASSAS